MIKVLNCSSKNYSKELNVILQKRRSGKQLVNKKVKSILNDIKKNAKFIKITKAGFYESMVHSVEMIEPTLNYKL